MIRDHAIEVMNRLSTKTLEETFKEQVREGLGCSKFESEALLETVKEVFFPVTVDTVSPGQMVLLAISAKDPAAKPLKDCRFLPIVVTLHTGAEDDALRRQKGVEALRRQQLQRMAHEAVAQGALLTAEDFAYRIFNCGMRTISRDLRALREAGLQVPLRSQQRDIGRALTHRVEAVQLYLERKTYSQIKQRIHHSYESIKNYITHFAAVTAMTRQGHSVKEIAFVTQISPALVRDYQNLLARYDTPEYRDRINEMVAQVASSRIIDFQQARQEARRAKKGALGS